MLGATQYELTDHLGNVRVATTQERTSVNFFTGMETEGGGGFENASETRHLDVNYNHTAAGSYSSWLNNAVNGQTMGPAITLSVNPGDTVRMSAYGMYLADVGEETGVINTLISALAGSFTGAPGLEAAEIASQFAQLPAAITGAGVVGQGSVPKAYLKYIIFDKDFNVVNVTEDDTDVDELTTAAHNGWEKLQMEVPITKNGYIYIYVANESVADVDVHFDDVEVTLIEGPMTSASDYYPFGLVMDGRSWTSEPYRFGYQGQFAEKDDETGWNAFELRMYDPVIGRWLSTDPYRQFASPYLGMGNSPNNKIDPDGGKTSDWVYNEATKVYSWDPLAKDQASTKKGFTYIGASLFDVYAHYRFENDLLMLDIENMKQLVDVDFSLWPGEINSYQENWVEKWEKNESFLYNFTYETVDGFYVTGQFFTPWYNGYHLNGKRTEGDDGAEAWANSFTTVIPYSKLTTLKYAGRMNIATFNAFFRGNLSKLSPQVKGKFTILINNQIIEKPARNAFLPASIFEGALTDN